MAHSGTFHLRTTFRPLPQYFFAHISRFVNFRKRTTPSSTLAFSISYLSRNVAVYSRPYRMDGRVGMRVSMGLQSIQVHYRNTAKVARRITSLLEEMQLSVCAHQLGLTNSPDLLRLLGNRMASHPFLTLGVTTSQVLNSSSRRVQSLK